MQPAGVDALPNDISVKPLPPAALKLVHIWTLVPLMVYTGVPPFSS